MVFFLLILCFNLHKRVGHYHKLGPYSKSKLELNSKKVKLEWCKNFFTYVLSLSFFVLFVLFFVLFFFCLFFVLFVCLFFFCLFVFFVFVFLFLFFVFCSFFSMFFFFVLFVLFLFFVLMYYLFLFLFLKPNFRYSRLRFVRLSLGRTTYKLAINWWNFTQVALQLKFAFRIRP